MPAQVLIDKAGNVRFCHYGHSMSDIPENTEVLCLADEINLQKPESDMEPGERAPVAPA